MKNKAGCFLTSFQNELQKKDISKETMLPNVFLLLTFLFGLQRQLLASSSLLCFNLNRKEFCFFCQ